MNRDRSFQDTVSHNAAKADSAEPFSFVDDHGTRLKALDLLQSSFLWIGCLNRILNHFTRGTIRHRVIPRRQRREVPCLFILDLVGDEHHPVLMDILQEDPI